MQQRPFHHLWYLTVKSRRAALTTNFTTVFKADSHGRYWQNVTLLTCHSSLTAPFCFTKINLALLLSCRHLTRLKKLTPDPCDEWSWCWICWKLTTQLLSQQAENIIPKAWHIFSLFDSWASDAAFTQSRTRSDVAHQWKEVLKVWVCASVDYLHEYQYLFISLQTMTRQAKTSHTCPHAHMQSPSRKHKHAASLHPALHAV